MKPASSSIDKALPRLLPHVQRPARYIGGEHNAVCKDWEATPLRIALAFPDIYDIGLPNLGLAILYDLLNRQRDMLAERVYLPWLDMEQQLRGADLPLFSLENKRPIAAFDVVGISLPYETIYTNVLHLLHLSRIPLWAAERTRRHPLIVAGGHATFNPEPMADFIDAFVIGDGEEAIVEIARCVQGWKTTVAPRTALLESLAQLAGVYVPSLYRVAHGDNGSIREIVPLSPHAVLPVVKRIVAPLPPPVTHFIVPHVDVVHSRAVVEIMRGCTRGCRFCHAGMVTRPVRERPVDEIVEALVQALDATGFEEVGLLSLSSSDYRQILELVTALAERLGPRRTSISLPSLRIASVSVDLMDLLQRGGGRRGGFTLAPEAASARVRNVINKPLDTAQLIETAHAIYTRGWQTIKLYFMIGHPTETIADVESIAQLAQAVLAEGRKVMGGRAKVHLGISTFVPKAHTPFQWQPCETPEAIAAKQAVLHQQLRGRGFKLSTTRIEETLLEAWLARGDRRLAAVIHRAWERGARFDPWSDQLRPQAWREAFADIGIDPMVYSHRVRAPDEVFPWDHIHAGVDKAFLLRDHQWSSDARPRSDCRDHCAGCGLLPLLAERRCAHADAPWCCPEGSP